MAKPYTNGFYTSKAWLECRDSYMRTQDYICERCSKPALIVHHKEYITPDSINDPSVTLNHNNLEALCQDCHNKEHFKHAGVLREDVMFDEFGNLVKV